MRLHFLIFTYFCVKNVGIIILNLYICDTMKNYILCAALLLSGFLMGSCGASGESEESTSASASTEIVENRLFGILSDDYTIERSQINQGETMGKILNNLGVSAVDIDRLDKVSQDVFPLRKIRGGNNYTTFVKSDTTQTKLDYLVYEVNNIDYVVFSFATDSIHTYKGVKPTVTKRQKRSATIDSSMWGAIMEANLPYALAAEIEDIYQWSVDFFAIQKGDNFTVIYEEKFVEDTISVGIGRVWGAKFNHGEQEYYAIPFRQNEHIEYWEEDGGSLRKQMLKAPLKYSRISSGFTYARLHPIYKVYRAHTGVDYAAPSGTPVHSVADGVVTFKGWGGGGGNTLKIKHPNNMTTGYLHLKGYAKGINQGTHVKQGQLIGYVGSTGASTGPHLDYRIWKGSTPINPLTIPQEPSEPISEENRREFEYVKSLIMAELSEDEVPMSEQINQLDSIVVPVNFVVPEVESVEESDKKSSEEVEEK